MNPIKSLIYIALISVIGNAYAFKADDERIEKKQTELNQACESARLAKLKPIREQAFNECMRSKRSTDTSEDCQRKTSGINANRQTGNPQFYDLPACVKAFRYQKENPKNS